MARFDPNPASCQGPYNRGRMALRSCGGRLLDILAASSIFASGQGAQPTALARRAGASMKSRRFETAERIYLALVKEFPDEPGLALNLALAQYSAGKFEDALKQFRLFLDAHPNHGPAWLVVGQSHLKLERPDVAVDPFKRAVAFDPDNRSGRLEIAGAFLRSGQPDQARAVLERRRTLLASRRGAPTPYEITLP